MVRMVRVVRLVRVVMGSWNSGGAWGLLELGGCGIVVGCAGLEQKGKVGVGHGR